MIDNLMPYMAANYSIATGRENTAIVGFSMGGRESLYIGISKPEYLDILEHFAQHMEYLHIRLTGLELVKMVCLLMKRHLHYLPSI